jgi:hypothetical protein
MKRSMKSKTPKELPESLLKAINRYTLAAAGAAAGMSLLSSAQPVEAQQRNFIYFQPEIWYSDVHVRLKAQDGQALTPCFNIDLLGAGSQDFLACDGYFGQSVFVGFSHSGLENQIEIKSYRVAKALSARAAIGPTQQFSVCHTSSAGCFMANNVIGPFHDGTNRYLGLLFHSERKTYYGWARFTIFFDAGDGYLVTELNGYAVETIPNHPILAGQIAGTADHPVFVEDSEEAPDASAKPGARLTLPEPQAPSLGLLALGAPAIPFWRSR